MVPRARRARCGAPVLPRKALKLTVIHMAKKLLTKERKKYLLWAGGAVGAFWLLSTMGVF